MQPWALAAEGGHAPLSLFHLPAHGTDLVDNIFRFLFAIFRYFFFVGPPSSGKAKWCYFWSFLLFFGLFFRCSPPPPKKNFFFSADAFKRNLQVIDYPIRKYWFDIIIYFIGSWHNTDTKAKFICNCHRPRLWRRNYSDSMYKLQITFINSI